MSTSRELEEVVFHNVTEKITELHIGCQSLVIPTMDTLGCCLKQMIKAENETPRRVPSVHEIS